MPAFSWSLLVAALWLTVSPLHAAKLDEMSLDRWARLGEADRYQMNIAEKYYREKNWTIAAAEYEKFLSLYEKSEGAAFAQLKWSMCQVHLRKLNTAIKDGYQSVIDYWPESPEAKNAAFLIGRTYKDMGQIAPAKKQYAKVIAEMPDDLVAVTSRVDLAEIARIEGDTKRRMALLQELTASVERTKDNRDHCVEASQQLATLHYGDGNFASAQQALATSYTDSQLHYWTWNLIRTPLNTLAGNPDNRPKAHKMADQAVALLRERVPKAPADDAQKNQARQILYNVADIEFYAGRFDVAEKVYDEALKGLSGGDETLSRKAGFYKSIGQRDKARAVYRQYENAPEGLHQVAYSYREENKYAEAVPLYEQLVAQDKNQSGRWLWELATCYQYAGKYKEAIATYRQTDRFPEDTKRMGECHRSLSEYKEALALFSQVLTGHEASAPWALLEIARTYEKAGQKEQAIKSYQAVCKRFPKSHEASLSHAHLENVYKINATFGGTKTE